MAAVLEKLTRASEYAGGSSTLDWVNEPSLVCQVEWGWLIPRVHRTLASPGTIVAFPEWNKDVRYHEFPTHAYWEAAHYLIRLLLGWDDPALGLERWLGGREGEGDSRLELLQTVWNQKGQLDLLLAWYGNGNPDGIHPVTPSAASPSRRALHRLSDDWQATFQRRWSWPKDSSAPAPWLPSGSNNLHLGHSLQGAGDGHGESDAGDEPTAVIVDGKRAVLVLERMRGWYAALERAGASLPSPPDMSWHIDVVVKPVGWLGTFKKSKVTKRWFQGTHSVHMLGN